MLCKGKDGHFRRVFTEQKLLILTEMVRNLSELPKVVRGTLCLKQILYNFILSFPKIIQCKTSEKCWECRLKVLPLFRVSESHVSVFFLWNRELEMFPCMVASSVLRVGSPRAQKRHWYSCIWERGFWTPFPGRLFSLDLLCAVPEAEQGWCRQDRQQHPAEGKLPSLLGFCVQSFTSVHAQLGLGGWLQLLQWFGLWSDKLESPWADEAPTHCAVLGGQHFLTGKLNAYGL